MRLTTAYAGWGVVAAVAALAFIIPAAAGAQVRYDRGQNVAPVYEGWEQNPDGTYTMVFGYMNRNYQEMPHVPVGADNRFEPGPEDRGQPTRFYPRRQQFVFRVQLPADWGEKDLIWTLTANGKTEQAFGSLWPSWQIDDGVIKANRGMGLRGAPADNQHPTIALAGGASGPEMQVGVAEPLTLTVAVSDDGIPGPRPAPSDPAAEARRRERPHPMNQAVVNAFDAGETGLAVTWVHYRGPGDATFDPMTISIDGGRGGEATTTVRFTDPGTHIIRAHADDSITTTTLDVTVTVR